MVIIHLSSYLELFFLLKQSLIYKEINIYVGNSGSGRETGPLGLIEAMASGVPCITTPSGIANDICEDQENSLVIDFDDYDGYTETVTNMPSAVFNVSCNVDYVDPEGGSFVTSNKTWHKQLVVKVTSPSMSDTIKMTKVFSYWKFP